MSQLDVRAVIGTRVPRTVAVTVWVCDACSTEACWQGILMCDDAVKAGVRKETRRMMAADNE